MDGAGRRKRMLCYFTGRKSTCWRCGQREGFSCGTRGEYVYYFAEGFVAWLREKEGHNSRKVGSAKMKTARDAEGITSAVSKGRCLRSMLRGRKKYQPVSGEKVEGKKGPTTGKKIHFYFAKGASRYSRGR